MNALVFSAFLLLSQAFEVAPIVGSPPVAGLRVDGIGENARFGAIGAMWLSGSDLYIVDGPTIRKLNLETRQVSTVTVRAGTGRFNGYMTRNTFSGLASLWGDGPYLYATDIGAGLVRRITISTGEVDDFVVGVSVPWGLTGSGNYMFVGNARTREILRVNRATRNSETFVELAPPTDPATCVTGSDCIGYYVPSPKDLSSDGTYIYATGLNKSIRRVEVATGATMNLPELPFLPGTLWEDDSNIYISTRLEIGRQNLTTGEYKTILRIPEPAPGIFTDGFGDIIGYNGGLYVSRGGHAIDRIDITSGQVTRVAGRNEPSGFFAGSLWGQGNNVYVSGDGVIRTLDAVSGEATVLAGRQDVRGFVDGVGTEAAFASPGDVWGDGSHLFVVDGRGIRRIDLATTEVTTLMGGPDGTPQNGPASTARLAYPSGIWGVGDYLFVPDWALWVIQRIDIRTGEVSTFAGGPFKTSGWGPGEGPGYVDGPGADARFFSLHGIWSDGTLLYVADTDKIRTVSVATAEVRTLTRIPGTLLGEIWGEGDNLYVAGDGKIWRVSRSTGNLEIVTDGSGGPRSGMSLQTNVYGFWGDGQNLFVSTGESISRLETRTAPTAVAFRLQPAEGSAWKTAGETSAMSLGYGVIDGAAESAGMVIYGYRQGSAIVSETSVPSSALVTAGRIYASVQGPINTGIAIANPGAAPADISFYFTDASGRDFGAGSFTIPAHQQIAKFLNEAPFSAIAPASVLFGFGSSIQGTFTFRSSVPVGAVALRGVTNERSEFLMTTLPISSLSAGSSSPVILPQYAAGGGWTTEVILVNPTDATISGALEFQITIPYSIPPRSSRVFASVDGPVATTGAVRVTPSGGGAPSTVATFSFRKNGVTVSSAGVPEVKVSKAFEVFLERDGNFSAAALASMGTGIAIANPGTADIAVRADLFSLDGLPTGRFGLISVPAQGHVALFTHEIPNGSNDPSTWLGLQGTGTGQMRLRISTESDSGISVIGLRARYNERGDFLITSTPALPDDVVSNQAPVVFPHFVQGSGYTTEFVFLNRVISSVAEGRVRHFSQSGNPIAIPVE